MHQSDERRIDPGDIAEAVGLLTRLPVASIGDRGALAAWAWPLAGALVALLAGALAWTLRWLGVPDALNALLVLSSLILCTGAMHEDGLADCADGFWGAFGVERRLEIMKDSLIGSYGVIALLLTLMMRWMALAAIIGAGWDIGVLVAVAALSRVPMIFVMAWMANVRAGGLADSTGKPPVETALMALILALILALLFGGPGALIAAPAAMAGGLVVAVLAWRKIGGQTGDVLGASQQLAEIGALAVFAALSGQT